MLINYIAHLQVILDDLLGGEPVIIDKEGNVEGSLGG